jgi:hypothetical protein
LQHKYCWFSACSLVTTSSFQERVRAFGLSGLKQLVKQLLSPITRALKSTWKSFWTLPVSKGVIILLHRYIVVVCLFSGVNAVPTPVRSLLAITGLYE